MKTALICHREDDINRLAFARWMASFSDLVLIIVICEPRSAVGRRVRSEWKRSGLAGVLDVFAFRLFHRFFQASEDRKWEADLLESFERRYPEIPGLVEILEVESPNVSEVSAALERLQPDILLARCKTLLTSKVFSVPSSGTFVIHPGICPEYRNSHGCFWALVSNDASNVGATLLKIDQGIDTGPIYGYYRSDFDETSDSHIVIQHKVVFDNLDAIESKLKELVSNSAEPIDSRDRPSQLWGQPRLSAWLHWRRRRAARTESIRTLMYHDVFPGDLGPGETGFSGEDAHRYKVSESQFTRHLEVLSNQVYRPDSSVDTTLKKLDQDDRILDAVFLTFDDGGSGSIEFTLDALAKHRFCGHFFVTTGKIGTPGFLSEEQIRIIDQQGHAIGSHSHTHPSRISALGDEALEEEWNRSSGILARILGKPTRIASVPGGYFSERVAEAAARAGIRALFTSNPTDRVQKIGDLTVFGRYMVMRHSNPGQVRALATGSGSPPWKQRLSWKTKSLAKKLGGEFYITARQKWLNRGTFEPRKPAS